MKDKKILVIVIVVVLMLVIGYLIINNSSNNKAIKIVKDKFNQANTLFVDDCQETKDIKELGLYCHYDTFANFKTKFYDIYDKSVDFIDIYSEYPNPYYVGAIPVTNIVNNYEDISNVFRYLYNDDGVFYSKCTTSGYKFDKVDDFKIKTNNSDTIEAEYVIYYSDDTESLKSDGKIKLVKEDDNWKIINVTIMEMCNSIYNVGR